MIPFTYSLFVLGHYKAFDNEGFNINGIYKFVRKNRSKYLLVDYGDHVEEYSTTGQSIYGNKSIYLRLK